MARRAPVPGGSGPRRARRRTGRDGSRCRRAGATHVPRTRDGSERIRPRDFPGAAPRRAGRAPERRDPASGGPNRDGRRSPSPRDAREAARLEIGEEDGDRLALTFERGLGGEDLLGEVLRGVRSGRGIAGCGGGRWCAPRRLTATVTELTPGRVSAIARRATSLERRSAAVAEPRARRIVLLAPSALHLALVQGHSTTAPATGSIGF